MASYDGSMKARVLLLLVTGLVAVTSGSAATPPRYPLDGVYIGDVNLRQGTVPTSKVTLVRADCNPDGISTITFSASGSVAQDGVADVGTFSLEATAQIGPQRFANSAQDDLDAGRVLSYDATAAITIGATRLVTTETLWDPGPKPDEPLPDEPFLRHNYGFCNTVNGMRVGTATGATGKVAGFDADARSFVPSGGTTTEGRAEVYLWDGAYTSTDSGALSDTRVEGLFGPLMTPLAVHTGSTLSVGRTEVVDTGGADPTVALPVKVRDATGAPQNGAALWFTYAGQKVSSMCVTTQGGCWTVYTRHVEEAPAHVVLDVLLDLNANGLADPGEPLRRIGFVTPRTSRVHASGLVRAQGHGTLPLRLAVGSFKQRAGGSFVLGGERHPLVRCDDFVSARFGSGTVVLRGVGQIGSRRTLRLLMVTISAATSARPGSLTVDVAGKRIVGGRLTSGRIVIRR
jgi:hypothetical protein